MNTPEIIKAQSDFLAGRLTLDALNEKALSAPVSERRILTEIEN